jgi:hypothetical protein
MPLATSAQITKVDIMTLETCYAREIASLLFEARRYIERSKRQTDQRFAVMLIDLAEQRIKRADEMSERGNKYMH